MAHVKIGTACCHKQAIIRMLYEKSVFIVISIFTDMYKRRLLPKLLLNQVSRINSPLSIGVGFLRQFNTLRTGEADLRF